jgi:hypothetical protein
MTSQKLTAGDCIFIPALTYVQYIAESEVKPKSEYGFHALATLVSLEYPVNSEVLSSIFDAVENGLIT